MINKSYCEPKRPTVAQTNVSVAATSTAVLAANSSRSYVLIQNISDTDIYFRFGDDATTSSFLLVANGGSWESPGLVCPTAAINAIHASTGTKALAVLEG